MGLRVVQKRFAHVSVARTFVACASPIKYDSVAHIKRLQPHDHACVAIQIRAV